MMRTPQWIAASSLAAALGLALPALAGPKAPQAAGKGQAVANAHPRVAAAREAAKERVEQAKEKVKAAREDAKDKLEAAKERDKDKDKDKADDDKGEHKGMPEAIRNKLKELRRTRVARRAARRAEIKKRWGALVTHPAVVSELKVHAWRMARLHRIRELADAEGKKDVVARVDKLILREQARHDKHMGVLKSKGGQE